MSLSTKWLISMYIDYTLISERQTLSQPGTSSCNNFIRALIFSLLAYNTMFSDELAINQLIKIKTLWKMQKLLVLLSYGYLLLDHGEL